MSMGNSTFYLPGYFYDCSVELTAGRLNVQLVFLAPSASRQNTPICLDLCSATDKRTNDTFHLMATGHWLLCKCETGDKQEPN